MPIYQYENPVTGKTVERIVSVEHRDDPIDENGVRLRRITAPQRLFVARGIPSPIDMKSNILKGYKRREEKQHLRRRGSYDAKTLKAAWA